MWKIILSIILILGCDDMATKYSNYTKTDPNPDGIIDAIDMDGKGLIRLSLTEWNTTNKPNVAQESIVENGGARFKTDTTGGDSILLTDPTTSTTVVDGPVYIVLNGDSGSGGYGNYAFTATVPTWSDQKQGYYLTGLYSDYRAVGGCQLASGVYSEKFVFVGRENKIYSNSETEYNQFIATEVSNATATPLLLSPTFSSSIILKKGSLYLLLVSGEIKGSAGFGVYYEIRPKPTNAGRIDFTKSNGTQARVYPYSTSSFIVPKVINFETSYNQYLSSQIFIATTSGAFGVDEYLTGNASSTVTLKNRNFYIKKISEIDLIQ